MVPPGARVVPARVIPVPETVSPELRALIAAPAGPNPAVPEDAAGWKRYIEALAAEEMKELPAIRERLGVGVTRSTLGGVPVFLVTPKVIAPQNRGRTLIHFHAGGYARMPGESGTLEAVELAGFGGFQVISVDYRMPPDHPFPAAIDDALAVYRAVLARTSPARIGLFGNSAGGALALITVQRAKSEHLAVPGAIAAGTPYADMTNRGDTVRTLDGVDDFPTSADPFEEAMLKLYTGDHDRHDPLLSPIYGDMHGFPPTMLTSGTRDSNLSDTVRVQRALRRAGVEAELQVWEGMSHGMWWADIDVPETKEYNQEVSRFFDRHLAR